MVLRPAAGHFLTSVVRPLERAPNNFRPSDRSGRGSPERAHKHRTGFWARVLAPPRAGQPGR